MSNGYQLARRRLLAKRRAALTRESWNKSCSPDLSPSRGVQFDFTNVPKDMLNEQRKHLLHLIKKVCERNDAILVTLSDDDSDEEEDSTSTASSGSPLVLVSPVTKCLSQAAHRLIILSDML